VTTPVMAIVEPAADPLAVVTSPAEEAHAVLELVAESVRTRGLTVPLSLESSLRHDLEFDSLGLLDLAMTIEERFAVDFTPQIVANIVSVRDIVTAIGEARRAGGQATSLSKTLQTDLGSDEQRT